MRNSGTFCEEFVDFLFRAVFLAVLKIEKTRVAVGVFSSFSLSLFFVCW